MEHFSLLWSQANMKMWKVMNYNIVNSWQLFTKSKDINFVVCSNYKCFVRVFQTCMNEWVWISIASFVYIIAVIRCSFVRKHILFLKKKGIKKRDIIYTG